MKKIVFSSLFLLLILTNVSEVQAYPSIKDMRSATYYPSPIGWNDASIVSDFATELPKMQSAGFNCVWLVPWWKNFEPVALPEISRVYNQTAFTNLKSIVTLLHDHNMCAIIPLDYINPGYSPDGVLGDRWMLRSDSFSAFEAYVSRFAQEMRGFDNINYLLFSEGVYPSGSALSDSTIQQMFRDYLYNVNPNISYWNGVWGTNFASFRDIQLANFWWSPIFLEWADYLGRAYLSQVAPLVKANGNSLDKIGYHWFFAGSTTIVKNRLYDWNTTNPNPFDFLSFPLYPDKNSNTTCNLNQSCATYFDSIFNFLKNDDSTKPIFMGEYGLSTYNNIWSDSDVTTVTNTLLTDATSKNVGFNIWMWKDYDSTNIQNKEQAFYGVYDLQGNPKSMFYALTPFVYRQKVGDINNDTFVNIQDYTLLSNAFGTTNAAADLNHDNIVNIQDYTLLSNNFGG